MKRFFQSFPAVCLFFLIQGLQAQVTVSPNPNGIQAAKPGTIAIEPVRDIRMNYTYTGPVSAITVNPLTSMHMVLASESGGLFECKNVTATPRKWQQLSDFTEHEIMDVLLTPAPEGDNLWVACSNTFFSDSGPLLWRRKINNRWEKVPFNGNWSGQSLAVYRVIFNPYTQKIYVAGDFGISIGVNLNGSATGAASGWSFTVTSGPGNQPVYAMDVLQDGTIIAGGTSGVFALSPGSTSWRLLRREVVMTSLLNRFCITTDAARKIITVLNPSPDSNGFKVYASADNGNSLLPFASYAAKFIGGAGGYLSVYPDYDVQEKQLRVYVSNRYEIAYAQTTAPSANEAIIAMRSNRNLSWEGAITGSQIGHTDTRHIAFLRQGVINPKMVVTSDGGFHIADIKKSALPGNYNWVMENANTGLKTLQVTSVTGKDNEIFFATWHDAFGASLDGGNRFTNGPMGEGLVLSKRGIGTNQDSRTLVTDGGPAGPVKNSRLIFAIPGAPPEVRWNAPPRNFISGEIAGPIYCSENLYIQQDTTVSGFSWSLTRDAGRSWSVIGSAAGRRCGFVSGLGYTAGSTTNYSLYIPVIIDRMVQLNRISNPNSTAPVITTPSMRNLEGGLSVLDLVNFRNVIYAVNPFDHNMQLATEASTGKMKKTSDGGNNWTEVTAFNDYYGDRNEPRLISSKGYQSVSVIAYSPYTNGAVLVGTLSQGLFYSGDGGTTWKKLNNPGVLMCTGIHWMAPGKAVVACYGRGLMMVNL